MGQTTLSGPIKAGTTRYNAAANLGYAVLSQSQNVVYGADTVTKDLTFYLPTGAQIIDIIFDILTVWNSAVAATGTVGYTSGGTEFASGVDLKAAAYHVRPTFTAAQVAILKNITTHTTVIGSFYSNGATTAGVATLTIVYAQK